MMKWLTLVVLLGAVSIGIYWKFSSPQAVARSHTQKALSSFSEAVATQDRAKIAQSLKTLISDNAKVRLEVTLFSIARGNSPVLAEDFDKSTFITFIDTTLYSLQNYSFRARVTDITLHADKKSASVTFEGQGWADGLTYYSGVSVNMRYGADTTCESEVSFDGPKATLEKAACKIKLESVPKPGQEDKLRDPDTLRQLLIR